MNYANSGSLPSEEQRIFRYREETGIVREFESDFSVGARKQIAGFRRGRFRDEARLKPWAAGKIWSRYG
jgi:hypothetical protein